MVIFRENTEDIYAGIEFESGSPRRQKVLGFLEGRTSPRSTHKIRFPETTAHRHQAGLDARAPSAWSAPPSSTPSRNKRKSVTLVHKGNIMKFTEGAFRNWGYALAEREFGDRSTPGTSGSGPKGRRARTRPTPSRRRPSPRASS